MPRTRTKRKPRPYRSAIRAEAAEQTRRAILDAARALLAEEGYGRLRMQAVADRAGVALDTVYAAVGKKPDLIALLVETAISNRDRAVPAEERDYVQRIRAARTAADKLAIYAAAVADIHGRLAPLVRAIEAAAPAHPEVAAVWTRIAQRRARNLRAFAEDLRATGELRPELALDQIADIVWATGSPELFALFEQRGWPAARYRDWLADAWRRLLVS